MGYLFSFWRAYDRDSKLRYGYAENAIKEEEKKNCIHVPVTANAAEY